jgi:hypothetical protein
MGFVYLWKSWGKENRYIFSSKQMCEIGCKVLFSVPQYIIFFVVFCGFRLSVCVCKLCCGFPSFSKVWAVDSGLFWVLALTGKGLEGLGSLWPCTCLGRQHCQGLGMPSLFVYLVEKHRTVRMEDVQSKGHTKNTPQSLQKYIKEPVFFY